MSILIAGPGSFASPSSHEFIILFINYTTQSFEVRYVEM